MSQPAGSTGSDRTPGIKRNLLNQAGEHIAGAEQVATTSPSFAITGAYDAVRHCVDAHLNAKGLRAKSGEGAHRTRVEYARIAMADLLSRRELEDYQAARQIRNLIEYPEPDRTIHPDASDVTRALSLAKRYHQAVTAFLRSTAQSGGAGS